MTTTPQQRSAELRRKIEAALAVASAATEGPWHWSHSPDDMLLGSDNRQSYICTVAHAYPSGNYSLDSFIAGQRQHNRDFIATARTVCPAALRAAIAVLDTVDGWLLTDIGPFNSGDECWYSGSNWGECEDAKCGPGFSFPVLVVETTDPSGHEGYLVYWESPQYPTAQRTWANRRQLTLRTSAAIPDAADRALHDAALSLLNAIEAELGGLE